METLNKVRIFNGNAVKLIAAAAMLVDHIGVLFFAGDNVLRHIGRISMPLFAFMIAEGCKYTKDRTKHFSLLFLLALLCQIVYYVFDGGSLYMSILVTFSLSVLMIYALQDFKRNLFDKEKKVFDKILSGLLFVGLVAAVYFLNTVEWIDNSRFTIDYGFWGCMLPVFASLFDFRGVDLPEKAKWLGYSFLNIIPFTVGLILLCLFSGGSLNMWWSLFCLPVLILYGGKKGKLNLKYFFYIFYPVHLAVLQGIAMLL